MTTSPSTRLLVHGARGKMGARLVALAHADARFNVVAQLDRDDHAARPPEAAAALAGLDIDVVIDFSSDEGAAKAAEIAAKTRAALLVGTTGLSDSVCRRVEALAQEVAVMIAPNTSLGVAVLTHLAVEAARLLGPEFDLDLIETHHNLKRDAPSGTAKKILQNLRAGAGIDLPTDRIHCLRAGDVIGEHTLQFAGPGERITLSHAATSRDLFARGALRAAAFLRGKPPGLYTIEHSLGLETSKRSSV